MNDPNTMNDPNETDDSGLGCCCCAGAEALPEGWVPASRLLDRFEVDDQRGRAIATFRQPASIVLRGEEFAGTFLLEVEGVRDAVADFLVTGGVWFEVGRLIDRTEGRAGDIPVVLVAAETAAGRFVAVSPTEPDEVLVSDAPIDRTFSIKIDAPKDTYAGWGLRVALDASRQLDLPADDLQQRSTIGSAINVLRSARAATVSGTTSESVVGSESDSFTASSGFLAVDVTTRNASVRCASGGTVASSYNDGDSYKELGVRSTTVSVSSAPKVKGRSIRVYYSIRNSG